MTTTVSAPDARAEQVLRACPQLRDLGAGSLRALAGASAVRHYTAGEPVFLEGGPGDAMFVLRQGAVVARISSAAGDVIDLGVAAEGHAFGYFEVLQPGPRTEDAVAVRDSTVVVVPAAAALRALRTSPETLLALARDLVRIVSLQNRARSGLRRPVDRRVAALLLELADGRDVVDFGGPQSLLAQRLGIARQSLNTALRGLADRGLLTVHAGGRGAALERAALAAHATGP
ncbi:Crp/Fnr family transcriptional regulator [Actinomycetospora cinnamomea]|uniref:CRP/FNR family transcriptional regulator n=1 Tax=Actinomycetospora cinnamomea TaxID=663609 RepID=A0A2U1FLH2_9PSEU|nr:Crp/Fnr family transcriptional regulator [Actinomycetospora cinnamomea]PVZ13017.1 CRP/FNR family transcriptional regulator [Actinomycetospora cinnamomea]